MVTIPAFDSMNETDVREIVVRPFLHKLGYELGTEANIRTEQTFRYERAFLGRKNTKKDPPLAGRADYILEVISYGRRVIEVKGPSENLSQDIVEQAHSYAAHPEVNALYFLITNGRKFELYRTSSLDLPLMAWTWSELDELHLALENLLGPEAIKRKVKFLEPDSGKPLGKGVASEVKIIGGVVRYEDHFSDHPMLKMDDVNGLELPVTGGGVSRSVNGRLFAEVHVAKSAPLMKELNELLERDDGYEFYSSDEYISTNPDKPTIFQNFIDNIVPAGTLISLVGMGKFPMPFGFRFTATTEAVGFVQDDKFVGTMQLTYDFFFDSVSPQLRAAIISQIGSFPATAKAIGGGTFEVAILNK